ncbi:MAG TPA: discoidin domain-containing protein, partial [Cytophagaceae bacterium]
RSFLLFIILFTSIKAKSQFQLNGNASILGPNTFQLTPATNWQFGAVWYQVQHHLDIPFNVQGQLHFGNISGGADGIVFVMQDNCVVAGTGAAGGGIGYGGMPGHSIAVEFDTFRNNGGAPNNNDPAYDHVAILKSGNVDHTNVANNLAGPVRIDPTKTDVKDGLWYDFRINYDPSSTTLTVYVNDSLRLSLIYDIKANVFNGNPYVYWGFVAATGGTFNDQQVRLDSLTTFALGDTSICTGGTVQKRLPPLPGPLISDKKTTVASSIEWAGTAANNATDGNMGTRWSSQSSDPQWIYIDLVNPSDIDSVQLFWENASAKQYIIQTSNDAVTWTDQYTVTNGPAGANTATLVFSASNVRYVRMYGIQRNTNYGYSLFEFRVYGTQKYLWSPDDGSINDIYSSSPIFSPNVTTTYSVTLPDPCAGPIPVSFTITLDCLLPVEISEFDVTAGGNIAWLTWTTASEYNTRGFEILRSFDAEQYSTIGYVEAVGNSNSINFYHFNDEAFYSDHAYYQLRVIDNDGSTQKSSIIYITKTTSAKPYVLQPVFEEETLLMLAGDINYVKYKVVNLLGGEVYNQENDSVSHGLSVGGNLKPGQYILVVETNLSTESMRIHKLK